MTVDRNEAWNLMSEWTEGDSLRKHMLAVEAAMRAYARKFGEDEEKWGVTGLLHDMDYEKHPTPEEHPLVGVAELRRRGYPEDVLHAIEGHADYLDTPRDTPMSKTLYAVDELSGFIVACALMRPERLEGMKAKSVRKKMKQKSFAAAVNREDIVRGAEDLGVDLNEHIEFVAGALGERADVLGLEPEVGPKWGRKAGKPRWASARMGPRRVRGERGGVLARVMVVFGGRSGEHEVSLASARAITGALRRGGRHEVVPVGITRSGRWISSGDPMRELEAGSKELPDGSTLEIGGPPAAAGEKLPANLGSVDVVFPVLHGPYGEDGTIQGMLELAGVPYVGSGVLGSAVGMDKMTMKKVFAHHGLPQVEWVGLTRKQWREGPEVQIREIEGALGYPCFVKPANLGSSVGIGKAESAENLATP